MDHSQNHVSHRKAHSQGCPVSTLLFIFVIEILAIQVRNDDAVHDLTFTGNGKTNMEIVQHTD